MVVIVNMIKMSRSVTKPMTIVCLKMEFRVVLHRVWSFDNVTVIHETMISISLSFCLPEPNKSQALNGT